MLDQLTGLGFSEGEARVYIAALELGEASVAAIAKKAKIERTTAYGFVEDLKKRGFISTSKKGRKTILIANDPKRLRGELEERGKMVDALLPQLFAIANVLETKPKIRFFDTREGIYDIYRETLEYPDSRIHMWMSDPWYDNEHFWREYYLPSRFERKIHLTAIMPKTENALLFTKDDKTSLRETRITDKNDITADIVLYGTRHVAITSFEEMTGLVIESRRMFETLRTIFNAHWHSLGGSE